MSQSPDKESGRAAIWILFFALLSILLVILYRDADQQDSGFHYLFARWSWVHPHYLIAVWARPLFTLIYSLPAQLGYAAAKLFTGAVCLGTAYQTWRLAREMGMDRSSLAIPFYFLQPAVFLISTTVLTEPLFAFVLVSGLRLHHAGRVRAGILPASLLILVRPEGFFIGILWGFLVIFDRRVGRRFEHRILPALMLASGMIVWWLAAYLISGDPLWIKHDWPPDWQANGRANGTGPLWWYPALLPLIVGPFLLPPFLKGLIKSLRSGKSFILPGMFLSLFVAHSIMFWNGWFGSAGYPRYLVCVSPVIALLTLEGWNHLVALHKKSFSVAVLALSLIFCTGYMDIWIYTRDAVAIDRMYDWYKRTGNDSIRPISRLICSQAYMRIVFDRDPYEMPGLTADRTHNLALIAGMKPGTLIFWDQDTGPQWYGLQGEDFLTTGYELLKSEEYYLTGYIFKLKRKGLGGARRQKLFLLYKP